MTSTAKTEKPIKKINNKKFLEKFSDVIIWNMSPGEVKRYIKEFPYELDFNIFQYGNLDIYDYDLYQRLYKLGLRTKAVMNYRNNLNAIPFPFKYREQIRNEYKKAIRYTVQYMKKEGLLKNEY